MSKMMILSALLTLSFAFNASAAVMNRAQGEIKLRADYAKEIKTVEDFKKEYEKVKGDMKAISMKQKKEFNEAISVLSGKVGMSTASLQRVFLIKADILVDIVRLEASIKSGTATEKEAALEQIKLIENVGKSMDSTNYSSDETKAAIKLLQLDLTTLPVKATEVVKAINSGLAANKSLTESVKEGTKGIKGTLKDLIDCV